MQKLSIQVKPGSRSPGISQAKDGILIVRVRSRAHEGKANQEVIKRLAAYLGVSKSQLEIYKGQSGRSKLILVHEK